MYALWGLGLLALRYGDLPRALPLLERAMGICHEADLPTYFPWMAPALGSAYILSGRMVDAVPLLTQATAMEVAYFEALCQLCLGEAQMGAGRLEEAQVLAEQSLTLARVHAERGNEAYALHFLGDIATHPDRCDTECGEAHYRQALALAEELGMRPLAAHCHRDLGTLYAATGQREQARTALSTAIEMYRALAMTFWLPQTEATLAQVGAAPA